MANPNPPLTTTIRVLDAEYRVRAEGDPEFVQDVAKYVDGTMRAVASRMSSGTQLQIMVMGAMNLAEELLRERRGGNGSGVKDAALEKRLRAVLERLEEATKPPKSPHVPAAATVARAGAGG